MATDGRHDHPALPARQGDTGAPGSAAPGTSTGVASVPPAAVVPVSPATRTALAVKRAGTGAVQAARELWLHPDRLLYVMWHGKPESMAEHRGYMKSRAWVPPGMGGGAEKTVIWAGLFYHLVIARPLKAAAKTVDAAADRPLRLLCLVLLAVVLVFLLARYL